MRNQMLRFQTLRNHALHRQKKYRARHHKKRWAGTFPLVLVTSVCVSLLQVFGITQDTILDAAVSSMQANFGYQTVQSCIPILTYDASASRQKSIYEYLASSVNALLPIYGYARGDEGQFTLGMLGMPGEEEESCGALVEAGEELLSKDQAGQDAADTREQAAQHTKPKVEPVAAPGEKVRKYSREKLNDFDYLLQNFYRVDSTTTTNSSQLNAAKMLAKDMRINRKQEGPQILIYQTHSQERFADSKDETQSVVGLGDVLTELLEEKYGYQVLHHKGKYDLPDRDTAYSRSAPALEQLLKDYPSIQVIIDLHRDGVAEGTRLVGNVNGKQTATIMFFNGLSHTTAQGDIGYLYNPNLADNLAFSFQMQLAAAEYYPGLSRFIYLRGYRYNMHYLPKSLLVEVGAQTNTYQEVLNAMPPLADLLDKVLSGKAQ